MNKPFRQQIVSAVVLVAAVVGSASGQSVPPTVDLTGRWAITIGAPDNAEIRSLEAVMAADGTLTGTLGSPNGSVPIRTGRVSGSRFSLTAMLGTGILLSYEGVVSRDTIRGTWKYDADNGHFVGRRGNVPPPAEAAPARPAVVSIDSAAKVATIESMLRAVQALYVDTARIAQVVAAIRARSHAGAYDTLTTNATFARGVTEDLRRFDKHFSIVPIPPSGGLPTIAARARDNYAIKRVERLDANVGYLRFDVFSADSAGAAGVLRTSLAFLARTDALIIDLRENHGGNGSLSQLLFSYFVPGPLRTIADMFTRTPRGFDSTAVTTAASIETALQYGDRPLYVLTSPHTASAAEWLSYNLQAAGRARVVGEVTAGAAHPIRFVRLDDQFNASIPVGRVRSRITKGDFEGIGVQPDVKTPSDRALDVAYAEILRGLLARATDPLAKAEVERALAATTTRPGAV